MSALRCGISGLPQALRVAGEECFVTGRPLSTSGFTRLTHSSSCNIFFNSGMLVSSPLPSGDQWLSPALAPSAGTGGFGCKVAKHFCSRPCPSSAPTGAEWNLCQGSLLYEPPVWGELSLIQPSPPHCFGGSKCPPKALKRRGSGCRCQCCLRPLLPAHTGSGPLIPAWEGAWRDPLPGLPEAGHKGLQFLGEISNPEPILRRDLASVSYLVPTSSLALYPFLTCCEGGWC